MAYIPAAAVIILAAMLRMLADLPGRCCWPAAGQRNPVGRIWKDHRHEVSGRVLEDHKDIPAAGQGDGQDGQATAGGVMAEYSSLF